MIDLVREDILNLADETYRDFQLKLLPGVESFVGVRLPVLRNMAKRIAKENADGYLEAALGRKRKKNYLKKSCFREWLSVIWKET